MATANLFTTSIRVPGGELPILSWMAVGRAYRRRGLLARMLRFLQEDARERGEPLAGLFASETPIYGRFGFGTATHESRLTIERAHSAFRGDAPAAGRVRTVTQAGVTDPLWVPEEF